jgi:hypothetical protein
MAQVDLFIKQFKYSITKSYNNLKFRKNRWEFYSISFYLWRKRAGSWIAGHHNWTSNIKISGFMKIIVLFIKYYGDSSLKKSLISQPICQINFVLIGIKYIVLEDFIMVYLANILKHYYFRIRPYMKYMNSLFVILIVKFN